MRILSFSSVVYLKNEKDVLWVLVGSHLYERADERKSRRIFFFNRTVFEEWSWKKLRTTPI
jgi:hypothetical protein